MFTCELREVAEDLKRPVTPSTYMTQIRLSLLEGSDHPVAMRLGFRD